MKIAEALLPTGKARKLNNEALFASLVLCEDTDDRYDLVWEGDKDAFVSYTDAMEDDWEPSYTESVAEVEEDFIEVENVRFSMDINSSKVYFEDYVKIKFIPTINKNFTMRLYKKKG